MSARNRELANLIVVGILTALGFASVYIARQEVVSTASLSYAGFFFALYLAAHVVARIAVPFADPYLLPMAGLLTGIGLTEIYRLNPSDAFRQGLWIVVALGAFSVTLYVLHRDYRRLESYKYLFGLGAIGLLVLPAVPGLGTSVNGARLWVHVGSLQFQPGELAKIMLIVFLAGYLREKREVLATGRLLYVGLGAGLFLGGAAGVYQLVGHVRDRVTIWLHPWTDHAVYCGINGKMLPRQDCASYQLVKSLYSVAHGNWFGTGLGKGTFETTSGQQLIPYLNTDFIYSALAQELGLVGVAALLLVFMLFVARGMKIAMLADDGFSKLLAVGLTFAFALQTFIIVGGILRIIPLTGITLPFVSYGGSSVVANFILLAGLLLVSNRANAERA
jgi:cell division protein FtsW (lipid II flippase)